MNPRPFTHSSPSQIKTFRRCKARWWAEKIAGMVVPPTPATIYGQACHRKLENYLVDAVPIDGKEYVTLAPALRLFPPPGSIPRYHSERAIRLNTGVVDIIGYIDLIEPGKIAPWCVTDLKTTSNLGYAPEEDELRRDPQCTIYTRALLLEVDDKLSEFRHVYAQTSSPAELERRILIERQENEDHWGGVCETVAEQHKLSTVTDMADIEGNLDACGDYGGCSFKSACPTWKKRGLNLFGKGLGFKIDFGFEKKQEKDMGLKGVMGTDEEKADLIKKLVAAGWDATRAAKMALPALRAMVAQLEDPVNPPDGSGEALPETKETADEGDDGDDENKTDATPVDEGKVHWKEARKRYAEVSGKSADEIASLAKDQNWKTSDFIAEANRLGWKPKGEATPAPAPAVVEPPAAPADYVVEVSTGTKLLILFATADGKLIRVPELGFELRSEGPLAASLPEAKLKLEAKLGKSVIMQQKGAAPARPRDPEPVHRDPEPTRRDPEPSPQRVPEPVHRDPEPTRRDPDVLRERQRALALPVTGIGQIQFWSGIPTAVSYTYQGQEIVRLFDAALSKTAILKTIADYPMGGSPVDLPLDGLPPAPPVVSKAAAPPPPTSKTPFSGPPPEMPTRGEQPMVQPPPAVSSAVSSAPVERQNCTLYLDAWTNKDFVRFEDFIAPITAHVEAENGVTYHGVIGFGNGPKLVAAELARRLANGLVLPERLAVTTFIPSAWPCVEVLLPRVDEVVRSR